MEIVKHTSTTLISDIHSSQTFLGSSCQWTKRIKSEAAVHWRFAKTVQVPHPWSLPAAHWRWNHEAHCGASQSNRRSHRIGRGPRKTLANKSSAMTDGVVANCTACAGCHRIYQGITECSFGQRKPLTGHWQESEPVGGALFWVGVHGSLQRRR